MVYFQLEAEPKTFIREYAVRNKKGVDVNMTDAEIIGLFFDRNSQAIQETLTEYRNLCMTIANSILRNKEDSEECLSDVLFSLWNNIPPTKPDNFEAYLTNTVHFYAYKMTRHRNALKRGGGQEIIPLDESMCQLLDYRSPESEANYNELIRLLDMFIDGLQEIEQFVFMRRYWFMNSIRDIVNETGFSESKVKSMLFRIRGKLREYLHDEGGYLYEEI